jgi:hypothetical protein
VVYAWRADDDGKLKADPTPEDLRNPVFAGRFDPDVSFVGFDLHDEDLKVEPGNPGWFFILQEQPTEPRFGFDQPPAGQPGSGATWDDAGVPPGGHLPIDVTVVKHAAVHSRHLTES